MYKSLKKFKNIVVSGPQRSGTRIAAKILAEETDKTYIDEKRIHYHALRLLNIHLNIGNVVIQCPGLCHLLHYILRKDTLIIVIRRDINEIIASEQRCWDDSYRDIELYKYGCTKGIISTIKYDFWEDVQKPILGKMAREIDYQFLEKHPLFIKNRKNFKWDQTENDKS